MAQGAVSLVEQRAELQRGARMVQRLEIAVPRRMVQARAGRLSGLHVRPENDRVLH